MTTPTPLHPPHTLPNKTAIITGASRGIGLAIAHDLSTRGYNLTLTYVSTTSTPPINALLARLPPTTAIAVRADLRDPASAAHIVAETVAAFGRVDVLVNNAGCEVVGALEAVTLAAYESVYQLNVRAPMLLAQAVLPYFPRGPGGGGRIVNVGSVGSRAGFAGLSVYCSSKAALEGLTRCWAAELGGRGVTVNQVNPGPVEGEMIANIPAEIVEMQKRGTPMGNRLGTGEEVARVVGWLVGEESGWVTGQVISASGGWAMY